MTRKTDEEIISRIAELEEQHAELSDKKRVDIEGLGLVLRMSELQWVMGE